MLHDYWVTLGVVGLALEPKIRPPRCYMTTLGNWTAEERLPSRRRQGTGEALVSCHLSRSAEPRGVGSSAATAQTRHQEMPRPKTRRPTRPAPPRAPSTTQRGPRAVTDTEMHFTSHGIHTRTPHYDTVLTTAARPPDHNLFTAPWPPWPCRAHGAHAGAPEASARPPPLPPSLHLCQL